MRPALCEVSSQHDLAAMRAMRDSLDPGAQNTALPHVDLRHALWESPAGVSGRTGAKQQVSRARFLPYHDFGNMGMPVNAHVRQRVARRERARTRERNASRRAGPRGRTDLQKKRRTGVCTPVPLAAKTPVTARAFGQQ